MGIYGQQQQIGFGGGITPAVKYLIITNVGCFFLQQVVLDNPALLSWLALKPDFILHRFAIWQFVTYMFLHGGVFHILINMFILWMFGVELERYWGTRQFTIYYFVCGIGAGVVQLLVSIILNQNPYIEVIGASGAIYGLLMAFGMLFPNRIITLLLLFILPVQLKAKYLVMIFGLIALFGAFSSEGDNVAHFAHLGGMLVGFLYLKNAKAARRWGYDGLRPKTRQAAPNRFSQWVRKRTEKRRHMQIVRRRQQELQLRERVDAILDKINEVGYENLSDEEKQILKKASQYLSQQNLHSEGLS